MGTVQQGQQGSAPVLSAGFPNECQLRLLQAPHDLAFLVLPPGRPAVPQVSRLYRRAAAWPWMGTCTFCLSLLIYKVG